MEECNQFFSDSLSLREQLTTLFFLRFDTSPVTLRWMLFISSVSGTFFLACCRGPQGCWVTFPLLPGPSGQGGDGRWQERSWQQERRTSPQEHRDSVSPVPCEAKPNFDTWGPDRLVYSHSHFQPDWSSRCILLREYSLGMAHMYTGCAYVYSTMRAEAHGVYVLPACMVDNASLRTGRYDENLMFTLTQTK